MPEIKDFLETELGLNIVRVMPNGEHLALCPLHDDNDASLFINPMKGAYHCFSGCVKGSGGLEGLFRKLRPNKDLNARFLSMFPVVYSRKSEVTKLIKDEIDTKSLPLALNNEYLEQRGISNDTVESFDIKYHQYFKAVIVPLYMRGEQVGYVRRNVVTNPKYLNSPELDRDSLLFPYDKVEPENNKIIVVEGVFDAINAYDKGVKNVVATLGGVISKGQVRLLGSLTRNIILCPDNDSAGLRIAERNTAMLSRYGFNIEYTIAPDGKKDFGDVKDFSKLQTWSYFYLKTLKKDLNYIAS